MLNKRYSVLGCDGYAFSPNAILINKKRVNKLHHLSGDKILLLDETSKMKLKIKLRPETKC